MTRHFGGASRRRLTQGLAGVLLLVGGVVVGLVLSEAAYRVARHFVCVGGSPGVPAEPRSFGWTHRPGAAGSAFACFARRFEWQSQVQINTHGLRDREIEYRKPAGVRRVLLLGDSMTEAIQVAPERTFARLVEQGLRASGAPVEVINAGHAGFGTDNELLFYRDEGRRYDPDLVVQVFNIQNDVYENSPPLYRRAYESAGIRWPPKPWFSVAADGALVEHPAPPLPAPTVAGSWMERIGRWLSSHFFVLRSVERVLHVPTASGAGPRYPLNYDMYAAEDPTWQEAWTLTTRLTQELRTSVERDGHRFAVVVLPAKDMPAGRVPFATRLAMFGLDPGGYELDRPHRRILEFLNGGGFSFVDLSPVLEADAAAGGQAFFTWDVHLTEHGHAAVAPALTAFLRTQLGSP